MTRRTDANRGWTLAQVREFVRDARAANEHAWQLIPAMRASILGGAYAKVVVSQLDTGGRGTLPIAHLKTLWSDMVAEAARIDGDTRNGGAE